MANTPRRGKGETADVPPSIRLRRVSVCVPVRPGGVSSHHLIQPRHPIPAAVKTLMMCDSAAICWRLLMRGGGGFWSPLELLCKLSSRQRVAHFLPFVTALVLNSKSALNLHLCNARPTAKISRTFYYHQVFFFFFPFAQIGCLQLFLMKSNISPPRPAGSDVKAAPC